MGKQETSLDDAELKVAVARHVPPNLLRGTLTVASLEHLRDQLRDFAGGIWEATGGREQQGQPVRARPGHPRGNFQCGCPSLRAPTRALAAPARFSLS